MDKPTVTNSRIEKRSLNDIFLVFCDGFVSILGGGIFLRLITWFFKYKVVVRKIQTPLDVIIRERTTFVFVPFFLLFVVVLLYLAIRNWNISPMGVFRIGAVVSCLIGIYVLVNMKSIVLISDQKRTLDGAFAIRRGDFSSLQVKEYLGKYPNQLGLATFEMILSYFSENPLWFRLVWLCCSILNCYFIGLITRDFGLYGTSEYMSLLLAFAFLPNLFLFIFIYGDIPGLAAALVSIHCLLCYARDPHIRYLVGTFICALLAGIIRQNYLIIGIALVIAFLLLAMRQKKPRMGIYAGILALVLVVLYPAIVGVYGKLACTDFPGRQPTERWIAMGLQEGPRGNGQWNGYDPLAHEANWDTQLTKTISLEDIDERLVFFREHPWDAFWFFSTKVLQTWCEPTFMSLVHTLSGKPSYAQTDLLASLITQEARLNVVYQDICALVTCSIYLFALLNLIWRHTLLRKQNKNVLELLPYIIFIGFFLFELVWETRSRYVFPAVMILIPVAAMGIERTASALMAVLQRLRR